MTAFELCDAETGAGRHQRRVALGHVADRNNLAPRLGSAGARRRARCVRGGYGMFYDSSMLAVNTAQYFNPPQFNLRVFFPSAAGPADADRSVPADARLRAAGDGQHAQSGSRQRLPAALERRRAARPAGVGIVTAGLRRIEGVASGPRARHRTSRARAGRRPVAPSVPGLSQHFLVESGGTFALRLAAVSVDRPMSHGTVVHAPPTRCRSRWTMRRRSWARRRIANFPQNSRNLGRRMGAVELRRASSADALRTSCELPRGNA